MNRRTLFMLVTALAMLAPLSASASVSLGTPNLNVLSNGLIGYWPLDGNTTSWKTDTTADVSGNAHSGSLLVMSTTTSPVPGKLGGALTFSGTDSGSGNDIVTASGVPFTLSSFTYSFWIKTTSNTGFQGIVGQYAGSLFLGWDCGLQSGKIRPSVRGTTSSITPGAFGNFIADGKWHNVVVVNTVSSVSLYEDGVLVATQAGTWSSTGTNATPFTMGDRSAGNGTGFIGSLDDVRDYNRALSPQEISLLYAFGTIQAGNTTATNSSFSIDQGGLNGGLVAYWPLDGNTTSWTTDTTKDVSGNGNTGTLTGMSTTTSPVAGKVGGALKFNGTNSLVTATTPSSMGGSSGGTICGWGYRTSTANFVGFGIGSVSANNRFTEEAYTDGNAYFTDSNGGNGYGFVAFSGTGWFFLCSVFNGSQGTNATRLVAYINAVPQTLSFIGTIQPTLSSVANFGNIWIGKEIGQPSIFANGIIDDVRIYNRALSAQEISDLYKAGQVNVAHSNTTSGTGINAGLVGYWTFDGPSINWRTNTVTDMSGNGNTGTLVAMSTSSSPTAGKIGQALQFNGQNQYIDAPTVQTSIATVSAWVRVPSAPSASSLVAGWRDMTTPTLYDKDIFVDSSGKANWYVYTGGTVTSPASIADNKWHLLTATFNPTSPYLRLYVDGSLVASGGTNSSYTSYPTPYIFVGGFTTTYTYLKAAIDDVRIYNRALSAQEVQELYQMGR